MSISTRKLKWDKNISVDDNELDEQHTRLLEFTNNLLLHYNDKDDDVVVLDAIDSLINYCVFHFEYEENILRKRGFTGLDDHIVLHNGFKSKITYFKNELANGDKDVMGHMIVYLISWIKGHTCVEDIAYKNDM